MLLHSSEAQELASRSAALLHLIDAWRLEVNRQLDARRKVELGQFLTPMPVAQLMASMLECHEPRISLLDPCAGVGSLFAACIVELCQRPQPPHNIHITAYELDPVLAAYLPETLRLCQQLCETVGIALTGEIRQVDFLESAVDTITNSLLALMPLQPMNGIILNPPYRKLQTGSQQWTLLQQAGIKTTNLYTGFLALCMWLLEANGEMIAITPRSFCSGSYFKPFRETLLHTMTLRRLHLFESREHAFQEDDVLQETLILSAVKTPCTPEAATILITNTTGPTTNVVAMHTVPYHEVISPHDPQSCIRIVSDEGDQQIAKRMATLPTTLEDLGIEVSTGRVVDFRVEALLRLHPEEGTVPLLYPAHISSGEVIWPPQEVRKPGALVVTDQSRDLLVPNEPYVLVRRFSSKEEKRRIIAVLYEPQTLSTSHIAFENHLNYFHQHGHGLDPLVAKGLTAFLNSTFVDMYFRLFNGHTQVNATDLRHMRYPTRQQLAELATRLPPGKSTQQSIDILIEEILFSMNNHF